MYVKRAGIFWTFSLTAELLASIGNMHMDLKNPELYTRIRICDPTFVSALSSKYNNKLIKLNDIMESTGLCTCMYVGRYSNGAQRRVSIAAKEHFILF